MKATENKHNNGNKYLNFANKIIQSITFGCLKGRHSEKLNETKHYNTGEQLKLFDIKEETKEEIQDRRDAETTIEIIEGLFNLCLKNNNLQDDMELNDNATISKIKHNKIVAQSLVDNEKASYTHTQEFIRHRKHTGRRQSLLLCSSRQKYYCRRLFAFCNSPAKLCRTEKILF